MTKILRDKETVNALIRAFNTSRVTVLAALDCKTNSELANRIRGAALKMGCQVKKGERIVIIK